MTGSQSKSTLTQRVLERINNRALVISLRTMDEVRKDMGPDTIINANAIFLGTLMAQQNALLEELIADVKRMRR